MKRFLLLTLAFTPGFLAAQSVYEPAAAKIEQAAIAFVTLLDQRSFDEAFAQARAGAEKLKPHGIVHVPVPGMRKSAMGPLHGIPGEADLRGAFDLRRDRGSLSDRQTVQVLIEPLQSQMITGYAPGSRPRVVQVSFDTTPQVPLLNQRRMPAPVYRETVGGYLLPDGEFAIVSYGGQPWQSSNRIAKDAPAAGSGSSVREVASVALATEVAALLDAGKIDEVLARIRAASPEPFRTGSAWAGTDQRVRADFARRAQRGALRERKVMLVHGSSSKGVFDITIATIGERPPVPTRYGPDPMASSETFRVDTASGEARLLDYRFGY